MALYLVIISSTRIVWHGKSHYGEEMMLSRGRWVNSYLRRWKVALGAILTSSLLLASNVWAAPAASTRLGPTVVHLASLKMETTTVGWATDRHLASPTALFGGQILHTVDGGRQWINVTPPHVTFNDQSGPPSLPHNTVTDFLSGSMALTATETSISTNGTGTVLLSLTHDDGHQWHQWMIHLPHLVDRAGLSTPILYQADFLNRQDGWLVFGPDSYNIPIGMELWRTTNGGSSWTRVDQISGRFSESGVGVVAGGITFTNLQTGWMIEGRVNHASSILMRTFNGGHTWTKVSLSNFPYETPIFHGAVGVLIVANGARMMRSTDDGNNWKILPAKIPGPTASSPFYAVQPLSGSLVWDLAGKRLWRSTNGGDTWTVQSRSSFLTHNRTIDFINRRIGWIWDGAAYDGKHQIWMTTDGGKHWTSWVPTWISRYT